jgi:erythromycin esterase-like protein
MPARAPAAVDAEEKYACARESSLIITTPCRNIATSVLAKLAAREAELAPLSSPNAFAEAVHHATVVVQSRWPYGPNRDQAMAENALWIRGHRGASRKIILWAHSGHLSETPHEFLGDRPMGRVLAETLGPDLFTITTLTAAGTFRQWQDLAQNGHFTTATPAFPPLRDTSYETYLRQDGRSTLLIPFRKALPQWLTTPAPYNFAGVAGHIGTTGSLPLQYDAAFYIETTTPNRPLVH